jgi:hypothetical protein
MLLTVVNEPELHYQSRRGINKENVKYCYCLAVALHFMVWFGYITMLDYRKSETSSAVDINIASLTTKSSCSE